MPADSDMVRVPRGTANACLAYLDTLDPLALGTQGQRAREGLRQAISASTPRTTEEVGTKPVGEQIVLGNDWQRRMLGHFFGEEGQEGEQDG